MNSSIARTMEDRLCHKNQVHFSGTKVVNELPAQALECQQSICSDPWKYAKETNSGHINYRWCSCCPEDKHKVTCLTARDTIQMVLTGIRVFCRSQQKAASATLPGSSHSHFFFLNPFSVTRGNISCGWARLSTCLKF